MDRISDLLSERDYKLGFLLGALDAGLAFHAAGLAAFTPEDLKRLREARDAYDAAAKAYLDARLAS